VIAARRSDHPELASGDFGGLSQQPVGLHGSVYWLSEVQHRQKRTDGARYARLVLDDARGVVIGLLWPEWLHQLGDVRSPGPVFVSGRLRGQGDDRCLHVERLRPVSGEALETGAGLLPRRLCPVAALPWLDELVAFERGLTGPLRRFLGDVLRDPRIGIPFMRCKASQNHHHAWPGGLLAHSMEMLPLVPSLVGTVMADEEDAVVLTQIGLLLHDVGKVLAVGESVRPKGVAAADPTHEAIGLELMRPHLARLRSFAPDQARVLHYLFAYLAAEPRKRGYPGSLLVDVVRQLDQLSTAMDLGRGLMPASSPPAQSG
jgi:3'-5' exoribonuclease